MQIQQMPESNQTTFPLNNFAERRGFEPRKPFWSLHAFQACLFNHSSISPSSKAACIATLTVQYRVVYNPLSGLY